MATRAFCEICDRSFKDLAGLEMHNAAKHKTGINPSKKSKLKNKIIYGGIALVLIFGLYWLITGVSSVRSLPPISMQGHIESSPKSHILKEPMALSVQKHMLEHIDGIDGAKGGVILNYDCKNFECESSLIGKLEEFANTYDYVYVAPFKNMPVKIALTKLGRIEKLDDYDFERIKSFIEL